MRQKPRRAGGADQRQGHGEHEHGDPHGESIVVRVSTGLPDGPTTYPLLTMLRWLRTPLPMLDDLARRYGPVFTLQQMKRMGGPMVFFADPAAILGDLWDRRSRGAARGRVERDPALGARRQLAARARRRSPHPRAPAHAAAVSRRAHARVRRDHARRDVARDRPLADEPGVPGPRVDAGDHARRDHADDLRRRRRRCAGCAARLARALDGRRDLADRHGADAVHAAGSRAADPHDGIGTGSAGCSRGPR